LWVTIGAELMVKINQKNFKASQVWEPQRIITSKLIVCDVFIEAIKQEHLRNITKYKADNA